MSESFESKPPDVLTPPTGPGHFIEIQDSLPARINDQLQHAIGPYELLTRSLSEVVGRNGAEVPIASAEEFAREFEAWLTPERLEQLQYLDSVGLAEDLQVVATPNITVSLEDAVRTLEKSVEGLQYREETLEVVKSVEQERQSGGSPLRSAISGTLPAETWSEGPEKPKVLFALISKKGLRLYTDESMPKALYPDPGDDTQLHPCIKSLEKPSILQALVLWQSTGGGGEISCITGTLTKGMSGAPIFARSRPSGFGGPVPASTLGIV